jgi:hypothetical protein
MQTRVKAVMSLAMFPLHLGAVLPELSLEIIRDALANVSKGYRESLFRPYVREYPLRTLGSVRTIQLTTPHSRMMNRAWARRYLAKYTESDAEREYRQEGPEYLELIVRTSCSNVVCANEPSSQKYRIIAVFKGDPIRNPTPQPYGTWEIMSMPFWIFRGTSEEGSPRWEIGGGEFRVAIPLARLLDRNADLEVVVSEPDGHRTEALFELSQLP